jgi:hypothetical protein
MNDRQKIRQVIDFAVGRGRRAKNPVGCALRHTYEIVIAVTGPKLAELERSAEAEMARPGLETSTR